MTVTFLRLRRLLSSIGPGIFIIGYVIGTGSVGAYSNPLILNIGLALTFVFSLFMAYTAFIGLSGFLTH